ncbi:hypothetical protein KBY88_12325 [Cyanobium sp. Morenito 9A2]|nr:hypothetical protein [Cyanobium sp. Morenito 9A2]
MFRPTFLTLRDHGKVYVADLPRLSDGQLTKVGEEAQEVLESLTRRLLELEAQLSLSPVDRETRIRASTKRDVTERFIAAVEDELERRRSNPSARSSAGESLGLTFLELARIRLPGDTFDALMQEALAACDNPGSRESEENIGAIETNGNHGLTPPRQPPEPPVRRETMPVVLTPDPPGQV